MLASALSRRGQMPGRASQERLRAAPRIRSVGSGALSEALTKALILEEPDRIASKRMHASMLADLCTRERVLVKQHDVHPTKVYPASLRVRFDLGTFAHDVVRNSYLADQLWGDWRCLACGWMAEGYRPSAEHGDHRCTSDVWRYIEREVERDGVVGHLDAMEHDRLLGPGVTEIKTMESARFQHGALPLKEHTIVLQVYLWLTGFRWGRLLYVSTGIEKVSPFKDYVFRYDLRTARRIAQIAAEESAGGKRACRTATDARALACPVRRPCWEGS